MTAADKDKSERIAHFADMIEEFARDYLRRVEAPNEMAELNHTLVLVEQVRRNLLPPAKLQQRLRDTAFFMTFKLRSPVIASCCDALAEAYEPPSFH